MGSFLNELWKESNLHSNLAATATLAPRLFVVAYYTFTRNAPFYLRMADNFCKVCCYSYRGDIFSAFNRVVAIATVALSPFKVLK